MRMKHAVAPLTAAILIACAGPSARAASPADMPFTVAKYPVDAVAQNAVAAKERALADGQQAALRSLFKRLVPVTAHARLASLRDVKATEVIAGVSVRSEQNSRTQYTATLDFAFEPRAVRELLRQQAIPFIDAQAPPVTVVPVYVAPPAAAGPVPGSLTQAAGAKTWTDVWKGLDLEHALAPVKLETARPELAANAVKAAQSAEAALDLLAGSVKTSTGLLAIAEADPAARRLHVTLAGSDAIGSFVLKRSWRLDADFSYTAELAAVVAVGILDGRWKAVRMSSFKGGDAQVAGMPEPVHLFIEFRNMQEWQEIRRRIAETPGVEDFQVGGLSARGADAAVRFPGGGEQLADALAPQGLRALNSGGTWVVRPGN